MKDRDIESMANELKAFLDKWEILALNVDSLEQEDTKVYLREGGMLFLKLDLEES